MISQTVAGSRQTVTQFLQDVLTVYPMVRKNMTIVEEELRQKGIYLQPDVLAEHHGHEQERPKK